METLDQYRTIIKDLLYHYASFPPSHGDIDVEVIIDERNDHYELMYTGWSGPYRIHGCAIHIDIRNGKVWIQHDGTDEVIAEVLVAAGIPRDQIVLGFREPALRQVSDYAWPSGAYLSPGAAQRLPIFEKKPRA